MLNRTQIDQISTTAWYISFWSSITLSSGSVGLWVWENFRTELNPAFVYYWTLINYYNAQYGSKVATVYMWYVTIVDSSDKTFDVFRMLFYST